MGDRGVNTGSGGLIKTQKALKASIPTFHSTPYHQILIPMYSGGSMKEE